MIKVIVADDHELMREGVKKILHREQHIQVIGEAANIDELLQLAMTCDADVLILDINFPARSGLDALVEIRRLRRELAVVVLSMYSEDRFALRVLKAGAAAYVNKASAADELVKAVRRAANGEHYLSPIVVGFLARELQDPKGGPPHRKLTSRESQVLSLIGAGKPAKQIADELLVSGATVNAIRTRILKKLGMHATSELLRYAIEHGFSE